MEESNKERKKAANKLFMLALFLAYLLSFYNDGLIIKGGFITNIM